MKKETIFDMIRTFLAPVLVILLGLMLLFNPDSASALISKLLGSVLILIGIGFGIAAITGDRDKVSKGITAVILAVTGGWLTRNPLALAAWFGRIVGIVLMINGIQDMKNMRSMGKRFALPGLVTLIGFVLILLPMTTTRLVFSACGVVVLILGGIMLLDRLRSKRLDSGDDKIVDAL